MARHRRWRGALGDVVVSNMHVFVVFVVVFGGFVPLAVVVQKLVVLLGRLFQGGQTARMCMHTTVLCTHFEAFFRERSLRGPDAKLSTPLSPSKDGSFSSFFSSLTFSRRVRQACPCKMRVESWGPLDRLTWTATPPSRNEASPMRRKLSA